MQVTFKDDLENLVRKATITLNGPNIIVTGIESVIVSQFLNAPTDHFCLCEERSPAQNAGKQSKCFMKD